MVPDPLPEAQIDQWRAIIRSDSSDLCMTTLGVIEADTDKLVTPEIGSELSLGAIEITISSLENYRLSGKEICFEVSAYLDVIGCANEFQTFYAVVDPSPTKMIHELTLAHRR